MGRAALVIPDGLRSLVLGQESDSVRILTLELGREESVRQVLEEGLAGGLLEGIKGRIKLIVGSGGTVLFYDIHVPDKV